MVRKRFMITLSAFCAFATMPAQSYIPCYSPACTTSRYNGSWATDTSINLYRCSASMIRSQADIERFMRNVCNYLGLTRVGSPQFVYHHAGNGFTSGLSAVQTANGHTSISIHVDELNNDIYLNFFSCAPYDAYEIGRRAQAFFHAHDMSYEVVHR